MTRIAAAGPRLSTYCGLRGYPPCALDGVTSGTGDFGCTSPVTSIDYCHGGGSGSGLLGGDGAGGEGSWGGTGPGTSPTEAPPDSCKTGSVVLDDPAVRTGFDLLWQNSSPDANLAQRHEQFGWIVRTATGYRIEPLGAGNFCGFDGTVPAPAEGNAAIVGLVHTHPYAIGEPILACDANMNVSTTVYQGGPSDIDRRTSVDLGVTLGRQGPLPGVVLDKSGMTVYAGLDPATDAAQPRCGY